MSQEKLSVISFNLDNPEEANNVASLLEKLILMYIPSNHREELEGIISSFKNLPVKDRVGKLQIELSNSVISYHLTEAIKARMEMEKMADAT